MISSQHPRQPMVIERDGVVRFKRNAIVEYLLDAGRVDMNHLASMGFSDEDRCQFAQLIGYSVDGYGDLPYVSRADAGECDELLMAMLPP